MYSGGDTKCYILDSAQHYGVSQLIIARAEAVVVNCRQQQAASDCNQGRQHTQCLAATLAAWIHDTLCSLYLQARPICTLLPCLSQPF